MNKLLTIKDCTSLKLPVLICAAMLLSACVSNDIVTVESSVKQLKNLNDYDSDGVIKERDKCEKTTLGAKIKNDGCHKYVTINESTTLDVKFAQSSATITADGLSKIKLFANVLQKNPDVKVVIEGHTSKEGSESFNRTLSQKRADAVVSVLTNDHKISDERVEGKGFGFDKLANSSGTEEAKKINRRIVASLNKSVVVEEMLWTIYSVD